MSGNTDNNLSKDVHLWAYTNFRLQTLLCKNSLCLSDTVKRELYQIGYEGEYFTELSDMQRQELLEEGSFFGSFQTGNRIVSFALKRSGLNRDNLDNIQESIDSAYEAIVKENGKSELSEASYRHTLQTLSVFRP